MNDSVEIGCKCGEVEGRVANATRKAVNRAVCHCVDCQAFLHHLGRADLLDERAGTDVVQVAPAALGFHKGAERIAGLRLSPKGLFRFYADCCKTPLGNTLGLSIPFVGIVAKAFDRDGKTADDLFGEPLGAIFGQHAVGTPPKGSTGLNVGLIVRSLGVILGWKVRGKGKPHPFLDEKTKESRYPLTVITKAERDALRELCGPRPG